MIPGSFGSNANISPSATAVVILHRLRTRLHDEEFAGPAVLRPFHIQRTGDAAFGAIVVFDHAGPARERENLVVRDRESGPVVGRHRHAFDHFASADVIISLNSLLPRRLPTIGR